MTTDGITISSSEPPPAGLRRANRWHDVHKAVAAAAESGTADGWVKIEGLDLLPAKSLRSSVTSEIRRRGGVCQVTQQLHDDGTVTLWARVKP